MKQACYRIEKDEYLTAVPCAALADAVAENGADYWLKIEEAAPHELASLIRAQPLHPFMVEDILDSGHKTLIDRYSDAVYIEFPTNPDDTDAGVAYLSIILTPHLITTIPRGTIAGMHRLEARFEQEIRPPVARAFAVLYYILDYFIDQNMQLTLQLRSRISSLEKAFSEDPSTIEVSTVTDLKQETSALISIAEDQRYCAKALENMHVPVLDFGEHRTYIRDLTGNAEQVLRVLARSEERLKSLYDSYRLAMNNTSEKRLRMLTVISAVFLPLTLITGFFGMNFRGMILLDAAYGIWLAIAIMGVVMLLMLGYFYRQGWFE